MSMGKEHPMPVGVIMETFIAANYSTVGVDKYTAQAA